MNEREIKAGAKMYFGAPAVPMLERMSDAIAGVVARVPGILEAHLPQCLIEGDTEARQVLVIGVQSSAEIPEIMEQLKAKLHFPAGQSIDILPFESGSMPPAVREAECQIFTAPEKPWWKVW